MTEAIPGAKRFKGELPAGTIVAHKTGTGGTQNGITSATNDIGIITLPDGRHLAMAAFVSDSAADDDTRDSVVARLAKAAWDRRTLVRQMRRWRRHIASRRGQPNVKCLDATPFLCSPPFFAPTGW